MLWGEREGQERMPAPRPWHLPLLFHCPLQLPGEGSLWGWEEAFGGLLFPAARAKPGSAALFAACNRFLRLREPAERDEFRPNVATKANPAPGAGAPRDLLCDAPQRRSAWGRVLCIAAPRSQGRRHVSAVCNSVPSLLHRAAAACSVYVAPPARHPPARSHCAVLKQPSGPTCNRR